MKTKTLPSRNLINRSFCRLPLLLIPLALACFALSPHARATCQDGCLTNGNTVLGDDALVNNAGTDNTAVGFNALMSNTFGSGNTAIGYQALLAATSGGNTAIGSQALFSNTAGGSNTATGDLALTNNTVGIRNTANGVDALFSNTTGHDNTANGVDALFSNTFGHGNTAVGYQALLSNTKGDGNIAVGNAAGRNLTTGDKNIDIGNLGLAGEAATIRIGTTGTQTNTYVAGINGATVSTGVAVIVDSSGHLGTTTSSARFKDEIKPMDKASEAILALLPVTFRYKHDLDPEGIPQFGLVAEDVEKVNPDLVARDDHGKPYTVRYDAVNAMLLNEFLKEHRKNEEQQAMIERQQKQIDALTAGLQKVSAQLELTKPVLQTIAKNQ